MLNKVLKELRIQRGLTQKEVANLLNMSTARYNQYETGKRTPDYETLLSIADFYNVSIDLLFGRTTKCSHVDIDPHFLTLIHKMHQRPSLQSLLELACSASDDEILMINQYIQFILHQNTK